MSADFNSLRSKKVKKKLENKEYEKKSEKMKKNLPQELHRVLPSRRHQLLNPNRS